MYQNIMNEASDKIKDYCIKIKNAFVSLVLNHFDSIKQIVSSCKEIHIQNLKIISDFNQAHQADLENLLIEAVKKNVIPDFYTIELTKLTNEIAHFKHLTQLVKLSCEIDRRINDKIGIFNIDLGIIKCKESIYKYNIHIII